jgi:hypothetical protein
VNELDYKFNQININNLQNLSQSPSANYYAPSPSIIGSGSSGSCNSIPQIPLQQLQLLSNQNQSIGDQSHNFQSHQSSLIPATISAPKLNSCVSAATNSRRGSSQTFGSHTPQHHHSSSLPTNRAKSVDADATSNYRNYDELNLIPTQNLDMLKLAVDQYGCRFLQKKLDSDKGIKDVMFNKLFNNLIELIVDPFGNYLIQKLVDYLTSYQKDLLVEKTHSYLFLIAINQYGTRSLQKIIDRVDTTYQMDLIIKGLLLNDTANSIEDNNIVKLIKDLNGNHVIQKCIFKFPPEKFQFIIDSICLNNNIVRISTHKHGCCVLQKLLQSSNFEQIMKISKILLAFLSELINDQFGNYIIQFLFELNFMKNTSDIDFLISDFFGRIYPNLVKLSCLKFSSNVIEKFIRILKLKQNYSFLNEIIKLINVNFEVLIKDKFGNYVIQTMIDQFYDVHELNLEMNILISTVKNYLPVIKAAPYARKIQLKIQQLETNYTFESHEHLNIVTPGPQTGFDPQPYYVDTKQSEHSMAQHNFNNQMYHSKPSLPYNFNPYFQHNSPSYNQNTGYHINNNPTFVNRPEYHYNNSNSNANPL